MPGHGALLATLLAAQRRMFGGSGPHPLVHFLNQVQAVDDYGSYKPVLEIFWWCTGLALLTMLTLRKPTTKRTSSLGQRPESGNRSRINNLLDQAMLLGAPGGGLQRRRCLPRAKNKVWCHLERLFRLIWSPHGGG